MAKFDPGPALNEALSEYLASQGAMLDEYVLGVSYINSQGERCFHISNNQDSTITGQLGIIELIRLRQEEFALRKLRRG